MADEVFSMRNGQKVDAHIHDPILDSVSEEADLRHRMESYKIAVEIVGIDPPLAAKLYGLEFPHDPLAAGPESLSFEQRAEQTGAPPSENIEDRRGERMSDFQLIFRQANDLANRYIPPYPKAPPDEPNPGQLSKDAGFDDIGKKR